MTKIEDKQAPSSVVFEDDQGQRLEICRDWAGIVVTISGGVPRARQIVIPERQAEDWARSLGVSLASKPANAGQTERRQTLLDCSSLLIEVGATLRTLGDANTGPMRRRLSDLGDACSDMAKRTAIGSLPAPVRSVNIESVNIDLVNTPEDPDRLFAAFMKQQDQRVQTYEKAETIPITRDGIQLDLPAGTPPDVIDALFSIAGSLDQTGLSSRWSPRDIALSVERSLTGENEDPQVARLRSCANYRYSGLAEALGQDPAEGASFNDLLAKVRFLALNAERGRDSVATLEVIRKIVAGEGPSPRSLIDADIPLCSAIEALVAGVNGLSADLAEAQGKIAMVDEAEFALLTAAMARLRVVDPEWAEAQSQ